MTNPYLLLRKALKAPAAPKVAAPKAAPVPESAPAPEGAIHPKLKRGVGGYDPNDLPVGTLGNPTPGAQPEPRVMPIPGPPPRENNRPGAPYKVGGQFYAPNGKPAILTKVTSVRLDGKNYRTLHVRDHDGEHHTLERTHHDPALGLFPALATPIYGGVPSSKEGGPSDEHRKRFAASDYHEVPKAHMRAMFRAFGGRKDDHEADNMHASFVQAAAKEGEHIPPAVLRDYPKSEHAHLHHAIEQAKDIRQRVDRELASRAGLPKRVPGANEDVLDSVARHLTRNIYNLNGVDGDDDHHAFMDKMQRTLAAAVDPKHTHLAFRIPHHDLEAVLKDRLRSQIEMDHNPARGHLEMFEKANRNRKEAEQNMYGFPEDHPKDQYPTYGYIDHNDEKHWNKGVGMFGNAKVHLKDHVRKDSTFTVGDSLSPGMLGMHVGAPLSHPHLGAIGTEMRGVTDGFPVRNDTPERHSARALKNAEFYEAHFHRPITHKDIAHVSFFHNAKPETKPSPSLLKRLDKLGITYSLHAKNAGKYDKGFH